MNEEESKSAAILVINSIKKIVEKGELEEAKYLLESQEIQETLASCHVTDYDDFMQNFVYNLLDKVEGFSFCDTNLIERYNDLAFDYQDSLYICQSFCLVGSLTILREIYNGLMKIRQDIANLLLLPEAGKMYKTLVDDQLPF